ncbi:phosphonate C-P lyase system protein PhnL [Methylobacterium brachiatum]|jgi:alpha-D-ribose 1-methylphosphonate 5-triphosphate synthase subunit PhnL|uniref:Alpha-D-ribose 1-methylphosphonate 5-triphosphate synthase subunit PhnL n=1 Tax=Methylobacterium brachiatum TaxID=269660 RepID=A0AAJ1TX62_9HYPH|nr:phosphonate C-P lyase system protein PhnL [Methylobacterium brachiatum]MCB4805332.1 phosphonate C-P lyase system protein PhnL [Methylobacterium brachiatum]MDQ0546379.1 alpha-D-ribose 1-methylphosphonate 5-triphosphate synthase subunit PhnL [Methylobacterium brachiatum]CAA2157434.1 Alpha-D-ribose 1-methylphosphonate 5-triphosphate synthase subunit PhnL [Methylobacterium brachiatum]SFJ78748.1 alpha-D-ribose 1-methylphosphonate 5-triphosphate synthase subunit PhnL [Methylobacterium brachiatum]
MTALLTFQDVAKSFTLHLRGGVVLPVVGGVSLSVAPGECVVLGGPSGAGKSSLLKMAYGNYRCDAGAILVRDGDAVVDVVRADPRRMLALRARVIAYVSQFLRVIPRVSTLDVVEAAGREGGLSEDAARARAKDLLARLNLPERLWSLPPATFSGGEQQRVNIARGLIADRPLLLLDEPTASLDASNRAVVAALVREKLAAGAGVLGIFHDSEMRDAVATRIVDVTRFAQARAA